MLTTSVKSSGNKDLSAAQPSVSTPTHTVPATNSGIVSAPDPRPVATTQFRDPGRYQIIAEHGRGGLGRVSRARDRELGRDVAIKELLPSNHGDGRFLREALITARLEHPGIVPVHEAGRWPDGTPFYAMKLVAGRPLHDLIAERTTVEERIGLLHHVIAVADAIAYAHDRNIIHRDLKPANVIVGDFGETIVIDWGLAKDVAAQEDSSEGPFRSPPADALTVTGGVLGTPGYMAPEQKRGENVDQRADVYAIGVMLWDLCVLEDVAPAEVNDHHRALRRAKIDPDLATIIEKALEFAPKRRYPHAGALAADLKAFKAGARISARSYSLPALLAHWIRRHRALALSVTAALVIATAGIALYVRNIATERRRATNSEKIAERAQASAEASLEELTLKHAQLLLMTDPSAAVDSLATYHGADLNRANQIRAEATGRGVAFLRAVPHTDNVLWAEGTPDGAVISLSTDGTISRTSPDGTSAVLARGVAQIGVTSYSPSRHLLAYACDPADLCLFDVLHNVRIPVAPMLQGAHVAGISFSPNGTLLALMSQEAVLKILDVTDLASPEIRLRKAITGGVDVAFLDDNTVAAGTNAGVEFVRMNGDSQPFSVPDSLHWDASASDHQLALATTRGQAFILESFPLKVAAARNELCHGSVVGIRFIPGQRSVAYGCREGTVGIWDLQRGVVSPRVQLEGHADRITVSPTGDYIIAAGGNGAVTVIDLQTNLVASYKGHGFRLTSITPPTPERPFLISADARGGVRAWMPPARVARVATTVNSPFHTAVFDNRPDIVTATTFLPALTTYSPSTGVQSLEPHEADNIFLEQSNKGTTFATYGFGDVVEVWSSATMTRTRVIRTKQGSVSQLSFVADTDDFVTSGRDGRLVRWTPSGEQRLIAQLDQPLETFAMSSAPDSIIVSTVDGALWRTDDNGRVLPLRSKGPRTTQMLPLPDQQTIYVGYVNGDVVAINTKSWQQKPVFHASGAVRDIVVTNDGHTIAIATNDGVVQVITQRGGAQDHEDATLTMLSARARHLSLAPDGLLVAACTDGTIWLYSPPHRRWFCLPTGTANLVWAVVNRSGSTATVLDSEGRLIWVDLDAVRKLLDPRGPLTKKEP